MLHLNDRDWKDEGRLVKVVIVVLADELFVSKPCLDEIYSGIKNKAVLLPVRLKDVEMSEVAAWGAQVQGNIKSMIQRNEVMEVLNDTNSIPAPGSVVGDDPNTIEILIDHVKQHTIAQEDDDARVTFPQLDLARVCPLLFSFSPSSQG